MRYRDLYDDSDNQDSAMVEVESLPKPVIVHSGFVAFYSRTIVLGMVQSARVSL